MSSSSSDSDAGERVKNVQKVLVRSKVDQKETDKNCSYKQRLGDLIFDANFEGGNLGYVEQIDEYEYDLMVRPDVANPRHRLWFNFTISNQLPNQIKLFHEGLTPVVRNRMQPNWVRLHEDQVFYHRSATHGDSYVLSIAFKFSSYDNEHQFALLFPYSYKTLENFIARWSAESKRINSWRFEKNHQINLRASSQTPDSYKSNNSITYNCQDDLDIDVFGRQRSKSQQSSRKEPLNCSNQFGHDVDFKADSLCTSILHKSIYYLTIKGKPTPECYSNSTLWSGKEEKSKVLIFCRMCGNLDGGASLVCQGLMDYVLSENLLARVARQYIDFLIFPMIDPDSICAGNSRSDILGQSKITKKKIAANPNIYSKFILIDNIVKHVCSSSAVPPRVIIIDICLNIDIIGSRICGTHYKDSLRMERHLAFPKLLSRFTDDFYFESCQFSRPIKHSKTLLDYSDLPTVNQYKLEVSPFAFYKRSLMKKVYQEYNQKKYLALGKAIVYSLLELLRSKERNLPHCVSGILESFRHTPYDIDDLLLSNRIIEGL